MRSGNVQLMEKSVITVKDQIILLKCAKEKNACCENSEGRTLTEYDQYFVQSVECTSDKENDWNIVIEICGKNLEIKLDTGAQVNVQPYKLYNRLIWSLLKKSRVKLVSYAGRKLNTLGKATLLVGTKDVFSPVEFQIV